MGPRAICAQLQMLLSLFAVVWGLWLLLPFAAFASASIFGRLHALADEDWWGSGVLVLGALSLWATWYGHHHARRWTLLALALWWGLVSMLFIQGEPRNTSTVVYPALALLHIYAYLLVDNAPT